MTVFNKIAISITLAFVIPSAVMAAEDSKIKLTQACEESLALSALPIRLRDGASVYTLTNAGFKLTHKSDGPFTCIVERNHPRAIIPQCADAAGTDSVIPGVMKKTEWALAGVKLDERKKRFSALAQKNILRAPERPGISYMMSDFNFIWNENSQSMMHVPAHVMYYAPNLSNDDVGGSFEHAMGGNRGTPVIVDSGIHGYMTSLVEKPSDSSAVLANCQGQIQIDEMKS
ncbi:hypothetical protein [Aliiglaciecola sp. M165]|uniref:hypothetical protein n=1 Tax=Aliiglaciecola sp. M165 TaxID=2593649 RepID=UPI00117F5E2F|nr:hypothetical protein [Aliiglaciecola sp. M165]TRY33299.1 hypothetical protein FM019_04780 [Aliiglaciecola sp. M165]